MVRAVQLLVALITGFNQLGHMGSPTLVPLLESGFAHEFYSITLIARGPLRDQLATAVLVSYVIVLTVLALSSMAVLSI
jgi:hypothetical protein